MSMTPKEFVSELDNYIIGQQDAKRAVAIALRNRWRRAKIAEDLREEVLPKNILMIGPTGVGKTEIARRVAKLTQAPFIKIEATKFTEVGYVGRDVDSIIRDLADISVKLTREVAMEKVKSKAEENAEERILDALVPPTPTNTAGFVNEPTDPASAFSGEDNSETRQLFRKQLREGALDDTEIEIDIQASQLGVEIMAPPGMEEMTNQLQNIFQSLSSDRKRKKKIRIKDAWRILKEEEASKLVNEDEIKSKAIENLEQNGIVFLDEMDKITRREHASCADVSREGVQRDLLPLIEGTTISTKYGMVKTDHILFITSGAFQLAKPSDLIAELQGRLPIRVELKALTTDDFKRILTEPKASLIEQYIALMETEEVKLEFTDDAIHRLAQLAWQVNEKAENIGARRLHTVMEKLLEDISFHASDNAGESYVIDAKYVDEQLKNLAEDEDLSDYIL